MAHTRASTLSSLLGMEAGSEGHGAEYVAYPNLRDVRWLFPAGQRTLLRSGIEELYKPRSFKGRLFKILISRGAVPGERVVLEQEALGRLEDECGSALGETEPRVAFYVGVPGAYRKVTALVMTAEGETLAFAKVVTAPLALTDVEAEQRRLTQLSEVASLRGRVPEALRYLDWQAGKILLMTSGPKQPGPTTLTSAHSAFCKDLFRPFARWSAFGQSPMSDRMRDKLAALRQSQQVLPDRTFATLCRASEHLHEELGSVRLPLSIAHRDFAPWNTRLGQQGLFVFDWDRAEYATPLYDAFHFQAIQAALFDRAGHVPGPAFLQDLLAALWPDGREHLPYLHLAYLLDQALFYAEARATAPEAGEGGVLDWFAERLRVFPDESPRL